MCLCGCEQGYGPEPKKSKMPRFLKYFDWDLWITVIIVILLVGGIIILIIFATTYSYHDIIVSSGNVTDGLYTGKIVRIRPEHDGYATIVLENSDRERILLFNSSDYWEMLDKGDVLVLTIDNKNIIDVQRIPKEYCVD